MTSPRPPQRLLSRGSWPETARIAGVLRKETVGGALLLVAAVAALTWANSPWSDSYAALRDTKVGPELLHLHLSLGTWAADGLLAIFFFVAGLELKREFVAGDLRDPARAAVPVAAAVAGVAVPALLYLAVNTAGDSTATSPAGPSRPPLTSRSHSPSSPSSGHTFRLRYAPSCSPSPSSTTCLRSSSSPPSTPATSHPGRSCCRWCRSACSLSRSSAASGPGGCCCRWPRHLDAGTRLRCARHCRRRAARVRRAGGAPRRRRRARASPNTSSTGGGHCLHPSPSRYSHSSPPVSPWAGSTASATRCANQSRSGSSPAWSSASRSASWPPPGESLGLRGPSLDTSLSWWDVTGLALLAGVGFTVSLLIGELAFGAGSTSDDHVKVAVLTGSLLAAALAAVVLRARSNVYERLYADEARDAEAGGLPGAHWSP